jgi:hypothetical protein
MFQKKIKINAVFEKIDFESRRPKHRQVSRAAFGRLASGQQLAC